MFDSLQGVVTSFNSSTLTGIITTADGQELRFPSTTFVAERTPRFPFVGEPVEVTLRNDRVLGVLGKG